MHPVEHENRNPTLTGRPELLVVLASHFTAHLPMTAQDAACIETRGIADLPNAVPFVFWLFAPGGGPFSYPRRYRVSCDGTAHGAGANYQTRGMPSFAFRSPLTSAATYCHRCHQRHVFRFSTFVDWIEESGIRQAASQQKGVSRHYRDGPISGFCDPPFSTRAPHFATPQVDRSRTPPVPSKVEKSQEKISPCFGW